MQEKMAWVGYKEEGKKKPINVCLVEKDTHLCM